MNHSCRMLLLILLCIAEQLALYADATVPEQTRPVFSEEGLRKTADRLYSKKQYGGALIACYRLLYSQTDDTANHAMIYGRIGLCNYKQDKFALADSFFLLADLASTSQKDADDKRISAAVLMMLEGRLGSTGRWLDRCSSSRSKQVGLLKRITGLFSGAKTIDRSYVENYPGISSPLTDTLLNTLLFYQKQTLNGNYFKKLLPGMASAVIPGSGQMLSGNIADGINSLLITGACIGVAAWAYEKDNISLFTPALLLSFNFYKGSVFNAIRGADAKLKRESVNARKTILRCLEMLFAPEESWN